MKASSKRSSLAALSLKTVGIILIVSSLLDYTILPIPYQPLDIAWRISLASTFVDRGIIPMIGLGLMFAGYKMDTDEGRGGSVSKKWQYLPFWGLVLAAVLGVFFALLTPMHLNDVRMASQNRLASIEEEARRVETNFNAQLGSEEFQTQLEQQQVEAKEQFKSLLENPDRLQTVIDSPDTPEEIRVVLEEAKTNPQALDDFFEERVAAIPEQVLGRVREQQENQTRQVGREAGKSAIRIGLSSLLLAVGYLIIGGVGLKGMMRPRR
ncbi:MAG: HpsJ family protein [Geitlerinemataceae cyanobacterium]